MDREEFKYYRHKLNKTQKQTAELLGVSLKTVQSYEQGWRNVPAAVERLIYFLVTRRRSQRKDRESCWKIKQCSHQQKTQCPAWEFRSGDLCWFINGTICEGQVQKDWKEKMKICRSCEVFNSML